MPARPSSPSGLTIEQQMFIERYIKEKRQQNRSSNPMGFPTPPLSPMSMPSMMNQNQNDLMMQQMMTNMVQNVMNNMKQYDREWLNNQPFQSNKTYSNPKHRGTDMPFSSPRESLVQFSFGFAKTRIVSFFSTCCVVCPLRLLYKFSKTLTSWFFLKTDCFYKPATDFTNLSVWQSTTPSFLQFLSSLNFWGMHSNFRLHTVAVMELTFLFFLAETLDLFVFFAWTFLLTSLNVFSCSRPVERHMQAFLTESIP